MALPRPRIPFVHRPSLRLVWRKSDGQLGTLIPPKVPAARDKSRIEAIAHRTESVGRLRLHPEYGETDATRSPGDVRSSGDLGDLYAHLVQRRKPEHVVEFGAAFGVSGMYFGSGLEANRHGHLYSFEINDEWADIAERNIRSITSRVTLTRGAFESNVDSVVPGPIDIAFVDGIHTYDYVMRQFDQLSRRMVPQGLILFDDIDFRKPGARMREAWQEIVSDPRVIAAVEVSDHLGVIELAGELSA